MSNALFAALRGDDVLMAAIDAADPDTYGRDIILHKPKNRFIGGLANE